MMREETCDVLVVGSGAGGLSAAVSAAHRGLKVIVAEKEPVFGGASARSGGWSWIPMKILAVMRTGGPVVVPASLISLIAENCGLHVNLVILNIQ